MSDNSNSNRYEIRYGNDDLGEFHEFTCGICNAELLIDRRMVYENWSCPNCNHEFRLKDQYKDKIHNQPSTVEDKAEAAGRAVGAVAAGNTMFWPMVICLVAGFCFWPLWIVAILFFMAGRRD